MIIIIIAQLDAYDNYVLKYVITIAVTLSQSFFGRVVLCQLLASTHTGMHKSIQCDKLITTTFTTAYRYLFNSQIVNILEGNSIILVKANIRYLFQPRSTEPYDTP